MPRSVLNRLIGAQFAKLEVNYCCGVWEKPHYQLLKKCQAIIGIFNGAGLCLGPAGASRVGSIHERKKQDTKDLRLFMATKQVLMRIVI